MCRLFIGAESSLWEPRTRSIRLDGVSTSVRLERFFWAILEEIGRRDGLSLSQLLAKLSRECAEAGHDPANFASFLRVCCGRYQALQLAGEIPAARDVSITSLDAEGILARERRRHAIALAPGRRQAEAASLSATS
ncbi:ribbon-helix-helix domain-containing protein [Halomonas sp. MCCC 1A17488]|uniref:ribbon-helix-helix domain-containing protein n=1 Tax=unclassified Halomonas TaxID=2609666 RepID=UPI0018D1F872|nr:MULTISPECIES: ribbon-helix-helix domain-containing protein [unclassified Halomonas]MCE8015136.1 ribbon-helix-helix domain-containing protein [Halomonas sp. MCCC 1A17488]MCG3238469.1 ribbon-helix-helix domain-containing protein [Halomonas sp. MCCC 1A17488]QPP47790.1 ribbon-helix-helix domain-containing protein [Halomonas sp. SS10-MC5]